MHIPSNSFGNLLPKSPAIDPAPSLAPTSTGFPSTESVSGPSFRDILGGAIDQVESARSDAKQSVEKFLAGDGDDLHSTILAGQRADLEFQMFLQVRNKVVTAYQEVMRMQM